MKNHVNPVWLIGLLQKQPKHFRLDGPTRLKFFQELTERKTAWSGYATSCAAERKRDRIALRASYHHWPVFLKYLQTFCTLPGLPDIPSRHNFITCVCK
jgi:hypothetical protein